ncbi:MAG TPA: cyclic nucleotide-binding domain-containing protein [Thermoanaerobaculia bacterium]
METLEPLLAEHPFVRGMSLSQIETIAGCASNVRFEAGQYFFKDGEEANQFYIIRKGRIAIEAASPTHDPILIHTYGDGEILGWSWLVPPYRWRFSGKALELTRVLMLDGKCLRGKCEKDHDLGYELLKRFADILAGRLDSARLQLIDMYASASKRGRR